MVSPTVVKLSMRQTASLICLLAILLSAAIIEGRYEQVSIQWHRFPVKSTRRMMIGSTMPTCTYNECRGCKYRCIAEQVPVEGGNDPINSAYHYRCVCRHA